MSEILGGSGAVGGSGRLCEVYTFSSNSPLIAKMGSVVSKIDAPELHKAIPPKADWVFGIENDMMPFKESPATTIPLWEKEDGTIMTIYRSYPMTIDRKTGEATRVPASTSVQGDGSMLVFIDDVLYTVRYDTYSTYKSITIYQTDDHFETMTTTVMTGTYKKKLLGVIEGPFKAQGSVWMIVLISREDSNASELLLYKQDSSGVFQDTDKVITVTSGNRSSFSICVHEESQDVYYDMEISSERHISSCEIGVIKDLNNPRPVKKAAYRRRTYQWISNYDGSSTAVSALNRVRPMIIGDTYIFSSDFNAPSQTSAWLEFSSFNVKTGFTSSSREPTYSNVTRKNYSNYRSMPRSGKAYMTHNKLGGFIIRAEYGDENTYIRPVILFFSIGNAGELEITERPVYDRGVYSSRARIVQNKHGARFGYNKITGPFPSSDNLQIPDPVNEPGITHDAVELS